MFTTSYMNPAICELITSFVKSVDPKLTVEIGAQRGHSAQLICQGMSKGSIFATFDLFEPYYGKPPYAETHANETMVRETLSCLNPACEWTVQKGTHVLALEQFPSPDLLHVDICNHYDNLKPILTEYLSGVKKALVLEGGITNHWQTKHSYTPWHLLMDEEWFTRSWNHITIAFTDTNAVTLCTRKLHG